MPRHLELWKVVKFSKSPIRRSALNYSLTRYWCTAGESIRGLVLPNVANTANLDYVEA